MANVVINQFGPSAKQILDAALAVATHPDTKLVVKSMPEGSTVLGGAEWSGRRKKDYERGLGYLHELAGRVNLKNQVFLGGACGVPWRADAIKELEANGCEFYNPEVDDWDVKDAQLKAGGMKGGIMELEAIHKTSSYVLLFVFDKGTRALATLNECVEFMMAGNQVVVIVSAFVDAGTVVGDQTLTEVEAADINLARTALFGLAASKGILVTDSVAKATKVCVNYLKDAAMDIEIQDVITKVA